MSQLHFRISDPDTWPPLMTIAQAARLLNVSPWTLRIWDNKGKLVAIRVGTRKDRRYRKEDIVKVIKEGLT